MRYGASIPVFSRATLVVLLISAPAAQEPAKPQAFDVVSIKESPPPTLMPGGIFAISLSIGPRPGGRWIAQNSPLVRLIQTAYDGFSLPGQIAGAPDWATRTRYEINAIAAVDTSSAQMNEMVKTMLAERFGLKTRVDKRELDVYFLVKKDEKSDTLGRGLRRTTRDCEAEAAARKADQGTTDPRSVCGSTSESLGVNGTTKFISQAGAMDVVAGTAQRAAGRPVVDRTGLTGRWDIELEYASNRRGGTAEADGQAVSIFTALQEQLGLKLEPGKQLMDVLVIEQAHTPTPD